MDEIETSLSVGRYLQASLVLIVPPSDVPTTIYVTPSQIKGTKDHPLVIVNVKSPERVTIMRQELLPQPGVVERNSEKKV